jgi:hypothetical protein
VEKLSVIQTPGLTTVRSGFDPAYPAPPRVHWSVLLLSWIAISVLLQMCAPAPYQGLLQSLPADAWAFYLCLWIRKLDPNSRSAFWCDAYVVIELAYAALSTRQSNSAALEFLFVVLGFASVILGIATIFLIRADLQKHYNEKEPVGLVLQPVMTFFFSFLYFQFHLYTIAKQKQQAAEHTFHPGGTHS